MYLNVNKMNIDVVEGTTHYINIECSDKNNRSPYSLEGYTAVFKYVDQSKTVNKSTTIINNIIQIKLTPADTIGKVRLPYECRIISNSNGDVFHICMGNIEVHKANIVITNS